jgi:hypothetical protein
MKKYFPLSLVLLCGCHGGHHLVKPELADANDSSTIVIIKDKGDRVAESGFWFGENDKKYAVIHKPESKEFKVKPGSHIFEVWSTGSLVYKIAVYLEPNSRTCIRAYADDAHYIGSKILPILLNTTYAYTAKVEKCS